MQEHSGKFADYPLGDRNSRADAGRASRNILAAVVLAIATSSVACIDAKGAPLSPKEFDKLAAVCAPNVSVDVLRAVASKESHFEPLALHDNTKKSVVVAKDLNAAIATAERWMRDGDSVDLGLMQINAPNLAPLGMDLAAAFTPCSSLAAAATVLAAAYKKGGSAAEQQAALLITLSRYNTGRPLDGVVNGYAADVVSRASEAAVPPIQVAKQSAAPNSTRQWDVWANPADTIVATPAWFSEFSETTASPGGSGTAAPVSLTTRTGD